MIFSTCEDHQMELGLPSGPMVYEQFIPLSQCCHIRTQGPLAVVWQILDDCHWLGEQLMDKSLTMPDDGK